MTALRIDVRVMKTAQTNGVDLADDGTYKLMLNDWVLIVIGIRYLSRKSDIRANYRGDEEFSHSFLPVIYGLSKSESTLAYSRCFESFNKVFHTFFPSSSFRVHSVTMDHSWAIRNGAVAAFGDEIRIISCWVHVLRKCKENVGKLVHKDYN